MKSKSFWGFIKVWTLPLTWVLMVCSSGVFAQKTPCRERLAETNGSPVELGTSSDGLPDGPNDGVADGLVYTQLVPVPEDTSIDTAWAAFQKLSNTQVKECPRIEECSVDELFQRGRTLLEVKHMDHHSVIRKMILPLRRLTHIGVYLAGLAGPGLLTYKVLTFHSPEERQLIGFLAGSVISGVLFGRWGRPYTMQIETLSEWLSHKLWGGTDEYSRVNQHLRETARLAASQAYNQYDYSKDSIRIFARKATKWLLSNTEEDRAAAVKEAAEWYTHAIVGCHRYFGGLNLDDPEMLSKVRSHFPPELQVMEDAERAHKSLAQREDEEARRSAIKLAFLRDLLPEIHSYISRMPEDQLGIKAQTESWWQKQLRLSPTVRSARWLIQKISHQVQITQDWTRRTVFNQPVRPVYQPNSAQDELMDSATATALIWFFGEKIVLSKDFEAGMKAALGLKREQLRSLLNRDNSIQYQLNGHGPE